MNINIEDLRVIVKESLEGRFRMTEGIGDEENLSVSGTNDIKQFIATTQNLIIGKVIKKSQSYEK